MNGQWCKRCPQCGNYMMKADPSESGMCCACGWEEYTHDVYCDVVNKNCPFFPATEDQPLGPAGYAERKTSR